jgi:hypothetical protein
MFSSQPTGSAERWLSPASSAAYMPRAYNVAMSAPDDADTQSASALTPAT